MRFPAAVVAVIGAIVGSIVAYALTERPALAVVAVAAVLGAFLLMTLWRAVLY